MSQLSNQPIPRLARALGWWVRFVSRHAKTVLTIGAIAAILSIYHAATHLSYRTSRDDLMSAKKDYQQRWQHYLQQFGHDEDIVVVVEGQTRTELRSALEAVRAELVQYPDTFDRVFDRVDLRHLRNRALLYLPLREVQAIRDRLAPLRVLLGPLAPIAWQSMTLQAVLQQANGIALRLNDGEILSSTDRELWRQLPHLLESAEVGLRDPNSAQRPWVNVTPPLPEYPGQEDALEVPHFFENEAGTFAFLLVRPVQEADSFVPAKTAVATLHAITDRCATTFPSVRFGLTGLPVLEHDEMSATEVDANRAAWLALLGVTLLYLLIYRGVRYPLLTIGTLVIGTIWSLGWLSLTVGHLNLLSATFAVMLIGMGDYGVLWVARYDAERQEGRTPDEALQRTAQVAGPSILTAAATTSVAFFATMLADFQAVVELGWIAGCGVILCAIACFTMLPALMACLPLARPVPTPRDDNGVSVPMPRPESRQTWLPALASHPRIVLALSVILLIAFGVASTRIEYDHNLLHMQPRNLESVDWELKLLDETTGAGWQALSIAKNREDALALKARFEMLPEVGRVAEVASLIPEDQPAKLAIFEQMQKQLRYIPSNYATMLMPKPDVAWISDDCQRLMTQLETLSIDDRLAEPELLRFAKTLRAMEPALARERIAQFDQRTLTSLAADLVRLRDVSHAQPITLDDLPPSLRERHIGAGGEYLLRVFARDSLWEFAPLEQFVQAVHRINPEATGKPFGTLEGLRSMKAGFQWAGVYALIAIVIVLAVDFRQWSYILLALVPLLIGVVVAVGLLSLAGIAMNPANLIALPLIVGVGVDNGVHVLHDYRERALNQRYRLSRPTGRGIMVAALTTMLGFGALMIGRHQGQSGLGLTLTLGVGCCMIAALVVLPAMLRLIDDANRSAAEPVKRKMILRFPGGSRRAA